MCQGSPPPPAFRPGSSVRERLDHINSRWRPIGPSERQVGAHWAPTLIQLTPMGAPLTPMWINVIPSGASGRGHPCCCSKARTSIPWGRLICVCSSICNPFPWELRYRLLNGERADPSRLPTGRQGDPTWVQVIQKGAKWGPTRRLLGPMGRRIELMWSKWAPPSRHLDSIGFQRAPSAPPGK